jgi:hypothetical protein
MGIKRFLELFERSFPQVRTRMDIGFTIPKKYEHVFIESNFLLHRHLHPGGLSRNHFSEYEMFLKTTNPSKHFYIVIDGAPPLIRIPHMRRNRNAGKSGWHKLQITCGSTFITEYEEMLSQWSSHHPMVRLSTSVEDGEGETKIFSMIRDQNLDNCLVISPDNDVIPMALSTGKNIDLLLFRRGIATHTKPAIAYDFIDINKVYTHLESRVGSDTLQARRDLMLLALFLGNDYLPRFNQQLDFNQSWMFYLELYSGNRGIYLIRMTQDGKWDLNWDVLKRIVKLPKKSPRNATNHEIYTYCRLLLWNFELYFNSKCIDQHLMLDLPFIPSIHCIHSLYMQDKNDFLNKIQPHVNTSPPLHRNTVTVAVMPRDGHSFVDERYRPYCITTDLITHDEIKGIDLAVRQLK